MTEPLNPEVAILNAALELPAGQRAAYLDEACAGDVALRQQIEALLRAHEGAEGFLDGAPAGLNFKRTELVGAPLTERPGGRIGHYKLLEQIGEGGCGVVYLAEQEQPVRRRVALKIIKLGMDTKQVIARFEAERQALALMDHPNIARVFDAGATETGRPYFVMELVSGIKITEFCNEHTLPTENRLKLFIQVCQAIQHAHQKGIIHRDIKPSNILVTVNDPDRLGVPKVIDFGIAKATQGRLTDETLFTAFEQFIGTPAYMSPEQAVMTNLDIDTRSDIYSLGVLLYELLAGRPPFDQKELLAAGFDAMRRTIQEEEPLKPSTRLAQLRVSAGSEIRNSKSEIRSTVPSDLDWIVMKCLEKDRAHRYETANGLAVDIQRHLDHEPVNARPPHNLYRLRKAVRRNKAAFAAATSVAIVLVIGVIVSTSQAIRARRAEREQIRLGRQAQTANRDLRATVSALELQRAESFFRSGDAGTAVAHLAAILRGDPSNHIAASRLVSALVHRNWALRTDVTIRHPEITSLSFSPNGQQILSASQDHTARIWDSRTGELLRTLRHVGPVSHAGYDSTGARIVTASADGTARVWEAAGGAPLLPSLQHKGKVCWAEFSPDGRWVVTASADRTARIWDAGSGALKHELRKHTSHIVIARFSPDSKTVATGGSHGSVRVWNVDSGAMLFHLEDRGRPLIALAISSDGSRLFNVCGDGIVRLWNLTNGQEVNLQLGNEEVAHAAFSPDGRFLLTSSHDATARFWDVNTGLPIGSPLVHEGRVNSGQFSSDGQKVVTLSRDPSARIWHAGSRLPFCQPIREPEEFTRSEISPDGTRLVTAGREGTIHLWNLEPRRFPGFERRFEAAITTVDFSSDGALLLATSMDGAARVFDVRTCQELALLPHRPGLYLARFSPDGQRVFTASENGDVRFWDWRKATVVAGPFSHAARISSIHFSPRGDRVVTACTNGTARVWDVATWQARSPPLTHGGQVFTARLSQDGRFVITASEDHTAQVWNASTGQRVIPALVHNNHVKYADFSPDGKKIVTASTDNTAYIWDLEANRPAVPPIQHARIIDKAVFSYDGTRIITASIDRTARIWDARTANALTPPLKHDYALVSASFSRGGDVAMTGCWTGALRAWDPQTGQPLSESLEAGGWISRLVAFDPNGRAMASGGIDAVLRLWTIPSSVTPVPEWFLTFAESVAGIRLDTRGHVTFVPAAEFASAVDNLKHRETTEFYTQIARWFLANPTTREATPF